MTCHLRNSILQNQHFFRPRIQYPIYDHCSWHSCPKHKLWRAFVDSLIDNDEKVASSKKHTQFKTRVQKPYPVYNQNGQNWYPIYDQNSWKTSPFGAAHTYIAHIREYSPAGRILGCQAYSHCLSVADIRFLSKHHYHCLQPPWQP